MTSANDGDLPRDNALSDRALRKVVVGRRCVELTIGAPRIPARSMTRGRGAAAPRTRWQWSLQVPAPIG
jgi:hypothetical protein